MNLISSPIPKKLNIVWNPSQLCVWNCKFCSINAKYSGSLDKVNLERNSRYAYGDELSFEQRIAIVDQLEPGKFSVDFGGGELFMDPLNVDLVLHASDRLGPSNVGLSISGVFVEDIINKLQNRISDIEVTLDAAPFDYYKIRPVGYHEYAGNGLINLKKHGFSVGAQTVLTKNNIIPAVIHRLFDWLCENNIDKWSLLRFFPSGRGSKFSYLTPTYEEYCNVVQYIKLISQGSNLFVHFQYLLPNHANYTLSCRAIKKSFGILPDGTVISCFWALDKDNRPLTEEFNLGRVPFQHINDILFNGKANSWRECESCKIFSN